MEEYSNNGGGNASTDGHAVKRQRTAGDDYGQPGKRVSIQGHGEIQLIHLLSIENGKFLI